MAKMTAHVLERTNPKGEPFVGRCVNCGVSGLSMSDANKFCDNQRGASFEESVVEAIDGPLTLDLPNAIERVKKAWANGDIPGYADLALITQEYLAQTQHDGSRRISLQSRLPMNNPAYLQQYEDEMREKRRKANEVAAKQDMECEIDRLRRHNSELLHACRAFIAWDECQQSLDVPLDLVATMKAAVNQ